MATPPSPAPPQMEVLDNETIKILQQQPGLISPPSTSSPGSRSVSNSSYMFIDGSDTTATQVQLPIFLSSKETLVFLEILPGHRERVWQSLEANLLQQRGGPNYDLLEAVQDHVIYRIEGDCSADDEDWVGLFTVMGMAETFIRRVMDPDFKHMRLMTTAKRIVKMYLEDRWHFLITVGQRIRAPGRMAAARVTSLGKHQEIGIRVGSGQRTLAEPSTTDSSGQPLISTASSMPIVVEGHKVLFKGAAISRLMSLTDSDGRLHFNRVTSKGPGDFHPRDGALYFTPQKAVAIKYAQWAAKIVDGRVIPVGILQVAVPHELLASRKDVVGDEWKKFVWHNRTADTSRDAEFKYMKDYTWLIGPTCCQSQRLFDNRRIPSERDVEIWRPDGEDVATQFFSRDDDIYGQLDISCVGKVWVEEL